MSQRRGLGGDDPAALEPTEDQRTDALGVARGIQGVLVHEDEAEGAPQLRQHVEGRRLERAVGVVGEQRRDQRRVGGVAAAAARRRRRRSRHAAVLDEVAQLGGVDEVAVVGQGDGALRRGRRGSAGRSPRWSRRWWSSGSGRRRGGRCSEAERALVEDLGDQAHVLVDEDAARRRRWRCPPTPARGAAARRGRSRSAWRRPRREPRRRRPRRRPAGPSRRGAGRG